MSKQQGTDVLLTTGPSRRERSLAPAFDPRAELAQSPRPPGRSGWRARRQVSRIGTRWRACRPSTGGACPRDAAAPHRWLGATTAARRRAPAPSSGRTPTELNAPIARTASSGRTLRAGARRSTAPHPKGDKDDCTHHSDPRRMAGGAARSPQRREGIDPAERRGRRTAAGAPLGQDRQGLSLCHR